MGKIRCDAGARDARRGRLYPKYVPVGPVTPFDPGCQSSACMEHRLCVFRAREYRRGPMFTPPKVRT